MAEHKDIEIRLPKKFDKTGYSADVRLRAIASEMTLLFYGKTMTAGSSGCLGRAQNFLKKRVGDKKVIVFIPQCLWDSAQGVYLKSTGNIAPKMYQKRKDLITTMQSYILNVKNHAEKHQVSVTIQYI